MPAVLKGGILFFVFGLGGWREREERERRRDFGEGKMYIRWWKEGGA